MGDIKHCHHGVLSMRQSDEAKTSKGIAINEQRTKQKTAWWRRRWLGILFVVLLIAAAIFRTEIKYLLHIPIATKTIMLPGDVPLELVWVPAGTFTTTGSSRICLGNIPPSKTLQKTGPITISQGFWMGRYEFTNAQWNAVMETEGANKKLNYPVDNVSWNDVQTFICKLNEVSGKNFRLPTSAEWEHACRAGTTTHFYWGDNWKWHKLYAWDDSTVSRDIKRIHDVGKKFANGWGLYDMVSNAEEWCQDGYYEMDTLVPPMVDPVGPKTSLSRALRSGGGTTDVNAYASNYVIGLLPDETQDYRGFRLLLP